MPVIAIIIKAAAQPEHFLIYSEKHYEITEVEGIRTVHIKQYIQYLLNKKLSRTTVYKYIALLER